MKTSRTQTPAFARQRGAILVTALLMLLTLTVIGVSVVQITRMQERMAGNTRDLNLAFQGAEAALRDGEAQLQAAVIITPCSAAPCDVFQRGVLPLLANQTPTWWNANANEYGVDGAQEIDDLDDDPQFVAEELTTVPDSLVIGQEVPTIRDFFQVTARSTGGTGNTNLVLQSTYAKRLD